MQPNEPTNVPEAPTFTPGIQNSQPLPPEPAPTTDPQPTQPEPTQPAADPTPADPQAPVTTPQSQPEAQQVPTTANGAVDYDAYLDSLIGNQPTIETPKPPTPDQLENDDQALTKFFDDLVNAAVAKAVSESGKQTTIRDAEKRAWDETFAKYPEIKESKGLRDTIHNIRIGAYQRGQALSPTQVADQLIGDLHAQYKRGVNDTNVTTTIRDSQPMGGGTPTPTPNTRIDYAKLHDGGESAAIDELTKLIDQGKI